MISQATALLTKGILGGGVPLASGGYIISITEYTPPVTPVTPPRRKGGTILSGDWKTPYRKPLKTITISCYAYGQLFNETVLVDMDSTVTVDNVEIREIDGQIVITVVDVKTY